MCIRDRLYIDLDEVGELLRRLWLMTSHPISVASFLPQDHLSPAQLDEVEGILTTDDLAAHVRREAWAAGAQVTNGPICLLTPLRHFGFYFSPLSIFYCWDRDMTELPTIVAEVNNTPWRQKHWYVLGKHNRSDETDDAREVQRYSHAKQFHVSPFMDMNQRYDWSITRPDRRLNICLLYTSPSPRDATLSRMPSSA